MGRLFKKIFGFSKNRARSTSNPKQLKEAVLDQDFIEVEIEEDQSNFQDDLPFEEINVNPPIFVEKLPNELSLENIPEEVENNLENVSETTTLEEEQDYETTKKCDLKKPNKNNFFELWKYISLSIQKATENDLFFSIIELEPKNRIKISSSWGIPKDQLLGKYLLVEKGDFVCNFGDLMALHNRQTSIFLWREEENVIISNKNYVIRANEKLTNEDFLNLVFTSSTFASKLSRLAFENQSSKFLSWEKFKNLGVNFPDLSVQKKIMERHRILESLLRVKRKINDEIERWLWLNFELLKIRGKSRLNKTFQELFEIVKSPSKVLEKTKSCQLKNIKSKFIFSEIGKSITEDCEFCKSKPCLADNLLLSKNVFETKEKKYNLRLWLGCDGYTSSQSFISFFPKNEIGIPYSYYLLKENLDKIITFIPGATTNRTLSQKELKVFNFQICSFETIKEFNEICTSVFKYQQILEEEIYKLVQLQKKEKEIIELKVFSEEFCW